MIKASEDHREQKVGSLTAFIWKPSSCCLAVLTLAAGHVRLQMTGNRNLKRRTMMGLCEQYMLILVEHQDVLIVRVATVATSVFRSWI